MGFIYAILDSNSLTEANARKKKMLRIRLVLTLLYFLVYFPLTVYAYNKTNDLRETHYDLLVWILATRAISRMIVDIYLFPAFIVYFRFFVMKNKSKKNKTLVVIWVIFLWFLKLLQTISNTVLINFY